NNALRTNLTIHGLCVVTASLESSREREVLFLISSRFYAFTAAWWDNSAMNQKHSSIYLIGMMGSGKSTIGKVLARTLHMPFVDLDHQIEFKCGVKIPVIFE